MLLFVLIALLNGVCIALSRILNGQLCHTRSAFSASYINHLVGFIFLTLLLLAFNLPMAGLPSIDSLPSSTGLYAGGIIGAMYVAVNSYIMTRLGSTHAILLVISGQMLFGVAAELLTFGMQSIVQQLAGVGLIIVGVWLKGHADRLCT